ncbi:TPA: endonuclease/exonuclease/phosphatase family protein, partial [Klebsiella pneumoniae]|nr:endonuclease/exonuclease/phosphatase family protein [Klebsiella pneumoniae]HBU8917096.1 endonuclease/exonuclease/phosphatase family protein [Klebsiella pneumoniae]HBV6549947.1 endonuclease/exonuclease/phosphatase family protein [Klebsiella pneumoniae]HBY9121516.1 endonuclease/exonuclease/phosphatase family protein [Klebsiella pneumoniae]
MLINLAWWNIGISPPIKKQKKDKDEAIKIAKNYIKKLSLQRDIDFFAICEISEDEAISFKEVSDKLNMTYLNLSDKVGRIIIDIAVMYEGSKLEYMHHKTIIHPQPNGRNLRVGVRVAFKDTSNDEVITFFLSHWPSMLSATDSIRDDIATALRYNIDKIYQKYGDSAQIICMGDYNTQPYSTAIHEKLFATRDYHIIKKRPLLLYNPFWGLLANGGMNNIGTYHYTTPKENRWYVLDQMMFSSSFLSQNGNKLKLQPKSFDFHNIMSDDENIIMDNIFF